jgi:hypothetical protein
MKEVKRKWMETYIFLLKKRNINLNQGLNLVFALILIFMKKILFITSFIFAGMIAHAQWYVSGSLSYETRTEEEDKYSYTAFGISPQIGYSINKKTDVGLSLGFSSSLDTQQPTLMSYGGTIEEITIEGKSAIWTIAPYLRYSVLQLGDFEILGNASFYFNFEATNLSRSGYMNTDSSSDGFGVGLNIGPTIQYNLSDRISLFSSLNFFNLRLGFTSMDGESDILDKEMYTNFGLKLDLLNMGNLGIGVLYRF